MSIYFEDDSEGSGNQIFVVVDIKYQIDVTMK